MLRNYELHVKLDRISFVTRSQRKAAALDNHDSIETLREQSNPILPEDNMAEAGRKAILSSFLQMLEHEAGSRAGVDIEEIHKMRVATRRMRSLFSLLGEYYRPKSIKSHTNKIESVAHNLGETRDLDVQIEALGAYRASLPEEERGAFETVFAILEQRRNNAHQKLVKLLDDKKYHKFVGRLGEFLTTPGEGARKVDTSAPVPYQVRHVLPVIIHKHLAQVRGYDTIIKDAPEPTLHALRIECKRLRYLVVAFQDVLGSSIGTFINELKTLQDHLGLMQDAAVGQTYFEALRKKNEMSKPERVALKTYVKHLGSQYQIHNTSLEDAWESFNKRTVQRRLSDALLVLR